MGRPAIDLSGQRFGKLTVVGRCGDGSSGRPVIWSCVCDCGAETTVSSSNLRNGTTASCGCKRNERKGNTYHIAGGVVHVVLTNSTSEMLCDEDDWKSMSMCTWALGKNGYAVTNSIDRRMPMCFHQLILERHGDLVRDHINRNKLDNRRCNLRLVTRLVNIMNSDAFDKYGWRFMNATSPHSDKGHVAR